MIDVKEVIKKLSYRKQDACHVTRLISY